MPNKTIYVPDDKVSVFDKATEVAGKNISPLIISALERYVEEENQINAGFKEIKLSVGNPGFERMKIFMGRKLVTYYYEDSTDTELWWGETIYETPKAYFVADVVKLVNPLETMEEVFEAHYQNMVQGNLALYKRGLFRENPNFVYQGSTVTVFKTLDELKKMVPAEFIGRLREALETRDNPVEYLDV